MNRKTLFYMVVLQATTLCVNAQLMQPKKTFTKEDTLRGTVTEYRKGWDVLKYELQVEPNINNRSLAGNNIITYKVVAPFRLMQIDLQQPLVADSMVGENHKKYNFKREGDICLVTMDDGQQMQTAAIHKLTIYYHGVPRQANNPPWDGGLVWKEDDAGNPYVATACQGLGASVWWPCKDHQSDEPDSGMIIKIVATNGLSAVSNGRLISKTPFTTGLTLWTWQVKNPINNYDVTMNIGKYSFWNETFSGEGGKLDLQFWALTEHLAKAKTQFAQAKPMLKSFEYWFGKYPFYEDGYKLVETPFLGMEHQSAVAYGNQFENGYLGKDLSGTGWGLKWDFIIVHESGHEWFGNNITSKDIGDMWLHEGFTAYSETLFIETQFGVAAGNEYNYGTRARIKNDVPIIGPYGVNKEGSGDMYYKGSNLLQLIRHSIDNEVLFRNMLRGLNKTFYHSTVTTKQVEDYISQQSKIEFAPVFNQYLRTTQIPALEYYFGDDVTLYYRWTNCVPDFNLALVLKNSKSQYRLAPSLNWQVTKLNGPMASLWSPDYIEKNYYIKLKKANVKPQL